MIKTCKFCKKEYDAWRYKQTYCSKKCFGLFWKSKHNRECRKCLECNEKFDVLENSNKKLCSVKCSNKYFSKNFSGKGNPNYGKKHPGMFVHTEEKRNKIKIAVTNHWKTNDRKLKHKQSIDRYKKEFGYYPIHSPVAMEKKINKQIEKIISGDNRLWTNSKRGYYTSTKTKNVEYYQSSYENKRMIELDNDENVLFWTKKHRIIIPYRKINKYYPDFFIQLTNNKKIIEEIKGYINDDEKFIDKCVAALKYCKKNNIEYKITFPNKKNFENHKHLLDKIWL